MSIVKSKAGWIDHIFGQMNDNGAPLVITALVTLKGHITDQEIMDVLQTRLIDKYPRFRSRINNDDGHWYEFKTTAAKHMHIVDLGDCKNKTKADVQTFEYLNSSQDSDSLFDDPQASPWNVTVLRHGSFDQTEIIFQIDHSIGDGITLSHVMASLGDSKNSENAVPLTRKKKKKTKNCCYSFGFLFVLFWRFVCTLIDTLWLLFGPSDTHTPFKLKSPEKQSSQYQVAMSPPFAVQDLKRAGRSVGGSVNDILMSILAGGIRRYLKRHETGPELLSGRHESTACCGGCIKTALTSRALVIFNPRAISNSNNVKKLLQDYANDSGDGNLIDYMVFKFPVDNIRPVSRVQKTKQVMNSLKVSPQGYIFRYANQLSYKFEGVQKTIQRAKDMNFQTSSFVSNLRGPEHQLTIAGYDMERLANWVCVPNFGIGCSFLSYNGNAHLSVCCNTGCMMGSVEAPSEKGGVQEFIECVEEEWQALLEEIDA